MAREWDMALPPAGQGKCERFEACDGGLNELIATPPQSCQHRERSAGGVEVRCRDLCASERWFLDHHDVGIGHVSHVVSLQ
jgi:hypothetical protein